MANRSFNQFQYSLHKMPVAIDCNFLVGATGAVTAGSVKGSGVYAVTRLAAGIYKVQFQDSFYKLYEMNWSLKAPVTGSDVPAGSLTPGVVYEITALGTTTTAQWVTAGVPVGITPAVGVSFLAAATSAGTGTAKAIGVSGISAVELVGSTNLQLAPWGSGVVAGQAGYAIVKCLGATDASTTTLIATDPAQNSQLYLSFLLSNSSVLVQGE